MAHKKGLGSSRNGRESNPNMPRGQGLRRPEGAGRRDHRPPARHPLSGPATASASAATTRSSRRGRARSSSARPQGPHDLGRRRPSRGVGSPRHSGSEVRLAEDPASRGRDPAARSCASLHVLYDKAKIWVEGGRGGQRLRQLPAGGACPARRARRRRRRPRGRRGARLRPLEARSRRAAGEQALPGRRGGHGRRVEPARGPGGGPW